LYAGIKRRIRADGIREWWVKGGGGRGPAWRLVVELSVARQGGKGGRVEGEGVEAGDGGGGLVSSCSLYPGPRG
jgi:hypothetical protein